MSDRLWWKHGVVYQIYPRSFMDCERRRRGRSGRDPRAARPPGVARHRRDLALADLPVADGRLRLRRVELLRHRPALRRPGRVRRAARRGARARDPGDARLGPEPHLGPARRGSASRASSRTSPKRDWYVWRDARADGSPPNNWAAMFGGPAWQLDTETGQLYLRSFLKEQPDLNWRNPEVERAMHGVLRFWLDRGVDGFRIDVIHRIAKDPELRDNPPSDRPGPGWGGQLHVNDENHPDIHGFLRRIRARARPVRRARGGRRDRSRARPGRELLGRGDELHLAFNFAFLLARWDAPTFGRELAHFDGVDPRRGLAGSSCSRTTTSRATRPAGTTPSSARRARARWRCSCSPRAARRSCTTARSSACATARSRPSAGRTRSPGR